MTERAVRSPAGNSAAPARPGGPADPIVAACERMRCTAKALSDDALRLLLAGPGGNGNSAHPSSRAAFISR